MAIAVKKKRKFGIVQGRLTMPPNGELQWFPQDKWSAEFENARDLGFDFIELFVEREHNKLNPVWTDAGRSEIKRKTKDTGLTLYSICNDFIINHSLVNGDHERVLQQNIRLFRASADLGCKVVILPLLEESALTTETTHLLLPKIKALAVEASELSLTICIETLMPADKLLQFLMGIGEANVKCVFDTGNRVLDIHDLSGEILLLGDYIEHVHIKDKNLDGENVILGTGLVNFSQVFASLKDIAFYGPLVFETYRGRVPVETAKFNKFLCEFFENDAG